MVKDNDEEMVAIYKVDAEVAQVLAKVLIEFTKCQSQREALEEIHARSFDLSAEIKSTKELEAEAKKLAYPEDDDDSEGLSEFEGGGDSEGYEAPSEDQAT